MGHSPELDAAVRAASKGGSKASSRGGRGDWGRMGGAASSSAGGVIGGQGADVGDYGGDD